MDNSYSVYCLTGPTGKLYIGITSQDPVKRWNNGNGYKNQPIFDDIDKYGWNSFEHNIIFSGLSKSEAEEKERYLIDTHKTNNPLYGYNIYSGGFSGYKLGCETKMKISSSLSGKNNPNYGKSLPEKTRFKMSNSTKGTNNPMFGLYGSDHPAFGHKHSEELKQHLSETNRGKNNPMHKVCFTQDLREKWSKAKESFKTKVVQIDKITDDIICIYPSISSASKDTSINSGSISNACSGKCKTAGGYRWEYFSS